MTPVFDNPIEFEVTEQGGPKIAEVNLVRSGPGIRLVHVLTDCIRPLVYATIKRPGELGTMLIVNDQNTPWKDESVTCFHLPSIPIGDDQGGWYLFDCRSSKKECWVTLLKEIGEERG